MTASFFIGTPTGSDAPAVEEWVIAEDSIVRLPLLESYANLTLKTRLMAEYAYRHGKDVCVVTDFESKQGCIGLAHNQMSLVHQQVVLAVEA